jgi:hypothetical protein
MNDTVEASVEAVAFGVQCEQMDIVFRAWRAFRRKVCRVQVSLSVIIPEWARIVSSGRIQHELRSTPDPCGIFCSRYKISLVRRPEINPELSVMEAQCPRPDATPLPAHPVLVPLRVENCEILHNVTEDSPIHQIFRV